MYTAYFGLTERPFQLTPDARYWFDSKSHRKALAYLGYGLAQGEGFVVVTGEIGAGKSTLIAHLMATIDRSRLNAISLVSTQVEGEDMLRLIAQGFGLSTAGLAKAQLLDAIERVLNEEARSGKRSLLVVDEAQNLTDSALEELRMLSNFQTAGRALIQILLTGQPEFRDRLAGPGLEQLRQRVIATHHMQPMEASEVEPYIVHRLTRAGSKGRPGFRPAAFAAIHAATDGIPRRINKLVDRLLLHAAIDRMELIDDGAVEAVAADMAGDQLQAKPVPAVAEPAPPPPEPEPVLSFRSARRPEAANEAKVPFTLISQPEAPTAPAPAPAPVEGRGELERRIAELEQRLDEQDKALRRVLGLMIDWVENDPTASARHNVA